MSPSVFFGIDNIRLSTDVDAPLITGRSPAPDAGDVAVDCHLTFEVDDPDSGVNLATLQFIVDRGAGLENAIVNGVAQAGFPGTITANGGGTGYLVDLLPSTPLPGDGQAVYFRVIVRDNSANELDSQWSVTTARAPWVVSSDPASWEADVEATRDISYVLLDDYSGCDEATLDFWLNGTAIITSGAFVPGYTGTITPSGLGLSFTVDNPPVSFRETPLNSMRCVCHDNLGNTLDETRYFDMVQVPPEFEDLDPEPGEGDVQLDAPVIITVTDNLSGVDLSGTTVEVKVASIWVLAFDGGVFQPGFSGTATPLGLGYVITLNHDDLFPTNGSQIYVRATTRDLAGNTATTTYWFKTLLAPWIASSDPYDSETGVSYDKNITVVLEDNYSGCDTDTINAWLNGENIIQNGSFLPGFTGRISFSVLTATIVIDNPPISLRETPNSLRITCEDYAGSLMDETITFGCVSSAPVLTNVSPAPNSATGKTPTIRLIAYDSKSGVDSSTMRMYVNGVLAVSGLTVQEGFSGYSTHDDPLRQSISISRDEPFGAVEEVSIRVVVSDNVGAELDTTYVIATGVDKPIADIRYTSVDAILGSVIQLDGRASKDPNSLPITFSWSFSQIPYGSQVGVYAGSPPPSPFPFTELRPNSTAVKFVPDVLGLYVVKLVVNNGYLDSDPVDAVVSIGLSQVPCGEGIIPDASFLWSFISDFWGIVEGRAVFESVWSSTMQVMGAELIKLWSNDYNKSLSTIQNTVHRRWQRFSTRTDVSGEPQRVIVGNTDDGVFGKTGILSPTQVEEEVATGSSSSGEAWSGTLTLSGNLAIIRSSVTVIRRDGVVDTEVGKDDGLGNLTGSGSYSISGSIDYTTGEYSIIESGAVWGEGQKVVLSFTVDSQYTNEFYLDSAVSHVVKSLGSGSDSEEEHSYNLGSSAGSTITPGTFQLWNSVSALLAASDFATSGYAHGTIQTVDAASVLTGETVVLSDGYTVKILEFRHTGEPSSGNVKVDLAGVVTATDVRNRIITAIAGIPSFYLTASIQDATTVALVNQNAGIAFNSPMFDTVSDPLFVVLGMFGGYKPGDVYGSRKATGLITVVASNLLADGDRFTVRDPFRDMVTFEYDRTGDGVTPGSVPIDVAGSLSAGAVRDRTLAALSSVYGNLGVVATTSGVASIILTSDYPGSSGNLSILNNVGDAGFTVYGMVGGYEVVGSVDYETWDVSFVEDGPVWGSGDGIRAEFDARPYFTQLSSLDLRSNARGRILVVNEEGYTIDRVYDTEDKSVILVDGYDIPGGLSNATWRIPHLLHIPTVDLENFGARTGDIVVLQITRRDIGLSSDIQAQIVGVDGDKIGFEFTISTLLPGSSSIDIEQFKRVVRELKLVGQDASESQAEAAALVFLSWMPTGINLSERPFTQYRVTIKAKEVIHNKVIRVNSSFVSIPTMQEKTFEPDTVLRENFNYLLSGGNIEFLGGLYSLSAPSPEELWAECTLVDNSSAIENNFGRLAGLRKSDLISTRLPYLSAVRGLWYALMNGPTVSNIRLGLQILLGLPFAEERSKIIDRQDEFSYEAGTGIQLGRLLVDFLDDDDRPLGIRMVYTYPTVLGLEVNPATQEVYNIGDIIERWYPISKGVEVVDYVKDPTWWLKTLAGFEILKYFTFRVAINGDVFSVNDTKIAVQFLNKIKPAYTRFITTVFKQLHDTPIDEIGNPFSEYLASTSAESPWGEEGYISTINKITTQFYDNAGGTLPAYRADQLSHGAVLNALSSRFMPRSQFLSDIYLWWDGMTLKATSASTWGYTRGRSDGSSTYPVREGDLVSLVQGQVASGEDYSTLYEVLSVVSSTVVALRGIAPHDVPKTFGTPVAIVNDPNYGVLVGGPLKGVVLRRASPIVLSGMDLVAAGTDVVTSASAMFGINGAGVDMGLVIESTAEEYRIQSYSSSSPTDETSLRLVTEDGTPAVVPSGSSLHFHVVDFRRMTAVITGVKSVYRSGHIEVEVMDPGDRLGGTPPGVPMFAFTPGMVGGSILIQGSDTEANNGVFLVTGYVHPGCVITDNPSTSSDSAAVATGRIQHPLYPSTDLSEDLHPLDAFWYNIT